MGVRRGRHVLHILLLCSVLSLVSCSHKIDLPDYQSGFSSLPATCVDAAKPTENMCGQRR